MVNAKTFHHYVDIYLHEKYINTYLFLSERDKVKA